MDVEPSSVGLVQFEIIERGEDPIHVTLEPSAVRLFGMRLSQEHSQTWASWWTKPGRSWPT